MLICFQIVFFIEKILRMAKVTDLNILLNLVFNGNLIVRVSNHIFLVSYSIGLCCFSQICTVLVVLERTRRIFEI